MRSSKIAAVVCIPSRACNCLSSSEIWSDKKNINFSLFFSLILVDKKEPTTGTCSMQINHMSSDSVFGWPIWLSGLPRSNMSWCFPAHFASWPSKWRVDFPEYLLKLFGREVLTVCIQGGISENETEEHFSLMLFKGHSANWFCNFFYFFTWKCFCAVHFHKYENTDANSWCLSSHTSSWWFLISF